MSGAYKTTWHRVHWTYVNLYHYCHLIWKKKFMWIQTLLRLCVKELLLLFVVISIVFGETQYSKMKEIAMCDFFFFFEFSYSIGFYRQMVRMACLKTWKFRIACFASSPSLPRPQSAPFSPQQGSAMSRIMGNRGAHLIWESSPGVGFRALDRELIGGT